MSNELYKVMETTATIVLWNKLDPEVIHIRDPNSSKEKTRVILYQSP